MVRIAAMVALALWSSAAAAGIRVSVTSAPEEQQARRLAAAVVKEAGRDPRFTLVEPSAAALGISLPARVGWERRLDWTEILFQARLNAPDGESHVFAGRCYNWNMSACAKQLLDAAAQVAGH
jgi:hypothetical protein